MQKTEKKESFYTVFSRRSIVCFALLVCLFAVTGIRIYEVAASDEYIAAQTLQSSYRENISRIRGTVYDCNLAPITNNKKTYYAAVAPTPDAVISIGDYLSSEEIEAAVIKLKENKTALCRPDKTVHNPNVATTYVYSTDYSSFIFEHIVGYTGTDGHGKCGIEAAYDDLLYSEEYACLSYSVSATGKTLLGEKPVFENDTQKVKDGVVLTLDSNIQKIAYEASKKLKKGAVVIAEAKTGKIKAVLSKPSFSPTKLSQALKDENSPLINRALAEFAVGSVFKPCVAAAAIEENLGSFSHICHGRDLIDGRYFSCHKKEGHGELDLKSALAFSCNSYFYNLGILLGGQKIRKSAALLSFGAKLNICKGISCNGYLTKEKDLKTASQIANFSIGQGDILISPTGMLTLYCAIASDGCYYVPSVVEATVKDGKTEKYDTGNKSRAMSEKTAQILREALREVVLIGTAKQANSEKTAICGKTATAQTGSYDTSGKEITNSWFCGFFPFEAPEYVGIIMSEGECEASPSLIFKEIAEKINDINRS